MKPRVGIPGGFLPDAQWYQLLLVLRRTVKMRETGTGRKEKAEGSFSISVRVSHVVIYWCRSLVITDKSSSCRSWGSHSLGDSKVGGNHGLLFHIGCPRGSTRLPSVLRSDYVPDQQRTWVSVAEFLHAPQETSEENASYKETMGARENEGG